MSDAYNQAEQLPLVYLAGAIRDGVEEDILWRERVIHALKGLAVFLNPCGGKAWDPSARTWTLHGVPSSGRLIIRHDFWACDRADVGLFNFLALVEGYRNQGTLIEWGRMTARGAILYAIVSPDEQGDPLNAANHPGLHPFIAEPATLIFPGVQEAIRFLCEHLPVLSGRTPHYGGYLPEG